MMFIFLLLYVNNSVSGWLSVLLDDFFWLGSLKVSSKSHVVLYFQSVRMILLHNFLTKDSLVKVFGEQNI